VVLPSLGKEIKLGSRGGVTPRIYLTSQQTAWHHVTDVRNLHNSLSVKSKSHIFITFFSQFPLTTTN